MKKIIITIFIILFSALGAFAAGSPRWRLMPLTIYYQPAPEAAVVQQAFDAWQNAGSGVLKFKGGSRPAQRRGAHITVQFIRTLAAGQYYDINYDIYKTGFSSHKEDSFVSDYFYRVTVRIRTADENFKKYTEEELYAIALQAAGRALGVEYIDDEDSVMSKKLDLKNSKITAKDIEALRKIYK